MACESPGQMTGVAEHCRLPKTKAGRCRRVIGERDEMERAAQNQFGDLRPRMDAQVTSEYDGINDSDKRTAATLAAALVGHGFTLPAATNATMAAEQAVDLYRKVLGILTNLDGSGERIHAQGGQAIPFAQQQEMDVLGIARVDSAKFCYGAYRYDNLSDALRYARAKSQATLL